MTELYIEFHNCLSKALICLENLIFDNICCDKNIVLLLFEETDENLKNIVRLIHDNGYVIFIFQILYPAAKCKSDKY